jgi:hypothetical protein
MKSLANIVIGVPISFLILSGFVGGFSDALAGMALSIICTAGVSLVIWIPIWYLLGFIAISCFEMAIGGTHPERRPSTEVRTQTPRDLEVVTNYLRLAESSNLSQVEITVRLEEAGWSRAIIDEARRQLTQPTHAV